MKLWVKQRASELRQRLGYYEREAIDIHSLLRKNSIMTVFKRLDSRFSGMTIVEGGTPFVLVNSDHSIGRQNFTICHELYHIFYDVDFQPHKCVAGSFSNQNDSEYKADLFAAYFLLPEEGMFPLIPSDQLNRDSITLDTILAIENYFRVSRRALLMRLKELGIISDSAFNKFVTNIISEAVRNGYPATLYITGNENLIIGDYGMKAKRLFDANKISESAYAELMTDINVNIFEANIDECI